MATYIKGVTDYIPQIQPWSPDYNFYQNALERKQNSYDKGWDQTNSIYNSILNAPMMREQNVERRDNFFSEIEGQIQQMSSVDLSLQQNVDAASEVFKPFYEDDNIIHDIAYTNKYQNQLQQADYLKNCTDKECADKYWAGGKRLMQYKAQDFINATDEQALNMTAPEFTSKFNLMENVSVALKEAGGFKMVRDQIKGGYNITTQNGEQVIGTLADFITQRFGDNHGFNDYNLAQASLLRYEDPEGAINEYEMAALQNKAQSQEELDQLVKDKTNRDNFNKAKGSINEKAEANRSDLEQMTDRRAALENIIMNQGILPNSPEDKAYRDILNEEDGKRAAVEASNKIQSTFENIAYTDDEGNPISNHMLDATIANAMMMEQVNGVARTLAYKDYSVTKKEDAFAVAAYSNKLGMQRDAAKQKAKTKAKTTARRLKTLREQAAVHKKYLLKKNFINMKTLLPRKPFAGATPLRNGGLGIGDPSDIVAQLDALIADGYTEEDALFLIDNPPFAKQRGITLSGMGNSGINPTNTSGGGSAKVALGTEVVDFQGYNSPTPLKPPNQYTDAGDIKVRSDSATADTRVAEQTQEALAGDFNAGVKLRTVTDDFISDTGNTVDVWKNNAKTKERNIVKERLNTLLKIASDNSNPSYGTAKNVVVALSQKIINNIEDGTIKNWDKPGSTWHKIVSWIPGVNNSTEYNPSYVKDLLASSKGMEDFIDYIGVDTLFDVMSNKSKGVKVKHYKNANFVPLENIDIINPNKAKALKARLEDEENPLSEKEELDLDEFDHYQSTPRIFEPLSGMSLGSAIPEMQMTSYDQLTMIRDAATQAKANFLSQMEDVNNSFIGQGETGGEKQDMPALETFLRKNIWNTEKNKKWGGLRSKAGLYKNAAEDTNLLGKYMIENPIEVTPDFMLPSNIFKNTIPDLEAEFASIGGANKIAIFQDQSLKNLLAASELVIEEPLPVSLDADALWKSNRKKASAGESIMNEIAYAINPNTDKGLDPKTWIKLFRDPQTQVQRKDNIVNIKSPHFTDGKPISIDLENLEILSAYTEMFQDIDDESGKVRAEFMNQADKMGDPSAKMVFPTGFKTNPGNFATVSESQEFMITPGDFKQATDEFTPLLLEIEKNFDDDLTKYDMHEEQGNKELLQIINRMFDKEQYTGKIPGVHIKYHAVYGNKHLTRVELELDAHGGKKYLDKLGYGKTGVMATNSELGMEDENKEKTRGLTIPTKGTYYIYDAKSPVIEKSKPNPYYNLVGLSNGDGYSDDTLWEETGTKINYKRFGDMIQYELVYQLYDYDEHIYRVHTSKVDQEPLEGTNWKQFAEEQWYELYKIFQKSQERRQMVRNTPGAEINNITYYNTPSVDAISEPKKN